MKELFKAIKTLFSAANTFNTAMGGQLYLAHADQETASFPYCLYSKPVGVSEWTYTEDQEDILIQFSIFSKNNSAAEIEDAFDKLKTLFDDAVLSVTGYTSLFMHRESDRLIRDNENNVWQHDVDYNISLEKQRT